MSNEGLVMIILLCYGFVGLLFHFCLSRRCYRLTGKMPKELKIEEESVDNYILNEIDLSFFSILWFLFPFFVFYHKAKSFKNSFNLKYYNKLIKMGLEEEEIEEEEDLSRGAYR